MFNPSLPRENIDVQAASTDGRATLYAYDQTHMFGRKEFVIKKQRGGFKYKQTKPSIFFFSYLKWYSNTYTFLHTAKLGELSFVTNCIVDPTGR
jgi:hypothetical protein